uniref:NADH dehydrogenase [ubiquinone] 1 beta subcomplex subunit 11, mitochondrial n=1 Tax=Syphacia muris TaxID=451379 RepID=A0A0N5ASV8_9BILA
MTSLLRLGEVAATPLELRIFLRSRLEFQLRCSSDAASHKEADQDVIERKPADYRPGADSYAYDNPWPKLNKGRFDWMFGDGWRRPLAKDQGAKTRRQWLWFGQCSYDEHKDWFDFHAKFFIISTLMVVYFTAWIIYAKPDWPHGREWALREAHLEIERRRKAGLPLISKDLIDPKRVAKQLPSDEELRDFDILI